MKVGLVISGLVTLLTGAGGPAEAQGDGRATAAISQFLAAYHHTASFSARMFVITRSGSQESQMTVDMVCAHPRNVALTVVAAPQFPACKGTMLTWLGDKRARVSTKFYGLPLGITVPVDDPRICNLRGYSIAQVDLGTELPLLADPSCALRYLGSNRVEGRMAEGIEVRSPHLLQGIEREVLWLDQSSHFPLIRDMYEAGRVVYHIAFSAYAFNTRIPASLFAAF